MPCKCDFRTAFIAIVLGTAVAMAQSGKPPDKALYDATSEQLRVLSTLKPLAKPHYSWPIHPTHLDRRTTSLWLEDYVRITRAATIDEEAIDRRRVATLVRICRDQKASLGLKMSPWHSQPYYKDRDPTVRGRREAEVATHILSRLTEFKRLVSEANRSLGAEVPVAVILYDTEVFELKKPADPGAEAWNAAMRLKYNAAYDSAKRVFPDAYVDWYGRGWMRFFAIERTTGWGRSTWFDLSEKGDGSSAVLYRMPMIEDSIECFRKTVADSREHGISKVTPWLGIGCGIHADPGKKTVSFYDDWRYPASVAARFGFEVNRNWDEAPHANFYPGPGQNPAWFEHFIAYCQGAAAETLDAVPDAGD